MFGIHSENEQAMTNFVYTERAGGKGPNEVISMLEEYLRQKQIISDERNNCNKVTLYADNCSGQNKNNFVLKFLLLLTDTGFLQEVNYKFYVKGHTKNACDRGFGVIKKKFNRENSWVFGHILDHVNSSATNEAFAIDGDQNPFRNYKTKLRMIYKDVTAIKKFQLFRMTSANPGVVECRKTPRSKIVFQNLRRDSEDTSIWNSQAVDDIFASFLPLTPPPLNVEKLHDIHKHILPFVPRQFRDDEIYKAPTPAQESTAKLIKKNRVRARQHAQENSPESKNPKTKKRATEGTASTAKLKRGKTEKNEQQQENVQQQQSAYHQTDVSCITAAQPSVSSNLPRLSARVWVGPRRRNPDFAVNPDDERALGAEARKEEKEVAEEEEEQDEAIA